MLRHNRVKRFTKILSQQATYTINGQGLFKRERNLVMKWTLTSDKSKIFLDIVDKDENELNMLNWELPFPQKFIISRRVLQQWETGCTTNPSRWRFGTLL